MFLLPFFNRYAFRNNTNRKQILRDCLTRRTERPAFLMGIQLIYLKVQLVLRNHTTIVNWLRNYVHYCRKCRHFRRLLLPLLGLLLALLVSLPSISTVLFNVVGITTFDTLRSCHPCLFHGIGNKLFTRFFGFFGVIRLVGFRTGALRFSLRLLLLHILSVILLGSLQRCIGLLLLLCPTCPVNVVAELGLSTVLSTPLVLQGQSCINDSMETHLNTNADFI